MRTEHDTMIKSTNLKKRQYVNSQVTHFVKNGPPITLPEKFCLWEECSRTPRRGTVDQSKLPIMYAEAETEKKF